MVLPNTQEIQVASEVAQINENLTKLNQELKELNEELEELERQLQFLIEDCEVHRVCLIVLYTALTEYLGTISQ